MYDLDDTAATRRACGLGSSEGCEAEWKASLLEEEEGADMRPMVYEVGTPPLVHCPYFLGLAWACLN